MVKRERPSNVKITRSKGNTMRLYKQSPPPPLPYPTIAGGPLPPNPAPPNPSSVSSLFGVLAPEPPLTELVAEPAKKAPQGVEVDEGVPLGRRGAEKSATEGR